MASDTEVKEAWSAFINSPVRNPAAMRAALDAAAAVDGDAQWNAARDRCLAVVSSIEDECEQNRLSFVQTRNNESAQLALFERNILRRALAAIRSLKRG